MVDSRVHRPGYYNNLRRKAIGQGNPPVARWITVEVNLLEGFRSQFSEYEHPQLKALHLKADSDSQRHMHSLVWLRSVSLHATSLRESGLREGDALGDTIIWYR